jgi:hypothetical protein
MLRLGPGWATILRMRIVGGRRARARLRAGVLLTALAAGSTVLAGCSDEPDRARLVQTDVQRLDHVLRAEVAIPTTDRAPAVRVTYDAHLADTDSLGVLVAGVAEVAAARDYPTYRLTLVPVADPGSSLTVDAAFVDRRGRATVLDTWLLLTRALLGTVTYDVAADHETIGVDSGGGAAHDVAEVRRIGHGTARTAWAFDTGSGRFTVTGQVTVRDQVLVQAVQRNAGAAGQPVWVPTWQLDRGDGHVRLDLEVDVASAAAPAQLTVARFGPSLAPLVRTMLTALRATGEPAWLRLHTAGSTPDDVFGSWATGRTPVRGRDPLSRGWDAWLVARS